MIGKTNACLSSSAKIIEIPSIDVPVISTGSSSLGPSSYYASISSDFYYNIPICNIENDGTVIKNPNNLVIKGYSVGSLTYFSAARYNTINTSNIVNHLNDLNIGSLFTDNNYVMSIAFPFTSNEITYLITSTMKVTISAGIISAVDSTININSPGAFTTLTILILGITNV